MPTIRSQQFTDSFKGFTFIVDKKINNEIENIFLHDSGNNLKNLSSDSTDSSSTTIIAEKGMIDLRKMLLFNGQIISTKTNKTESEFIKFEQLNIDLSDLVTTTIKSPKLQETNTFKLLGCFFSDRPDMEICKKDSNKEILPILIRRLVMPFYIPVITLICSFLLFKNQKIYMNKISIFIYSFSILLFTELIIRYTGLNDFLRWLYIATPFALLITFYLFLKLKFSNELRKT